MATIKDAASEFLAHKRVAVTGVSRTRLRERGYQVFAVNPNAEEVEGDPAFRDLRVPRRRQRLRDGDRVREGAWHRGDRRRLSVHVRPHRRFRSQGDAPALHPDRQRPEASLNFSGGGV